jgi:glycerol-3-phosphate dehydrogenase
MGSFALQGYLLDHSADLDAAVLSGTSAVDVIAAGIDPTKEVDLSAFNAPFEPARTEYDWLSRDPDEVDAYVADPGCATTSPCGGGVIGCAVARELSRYRLRAVLIDRECEVGLGTSKANSGIIHGATTRRGHPQGRARVARQPDGGRPRRRPALRVPPRRRPDLRLRRRCSAPPCGASLEQGRAAASRPGAVGARAAAARGAEPVARHRRGAVRADGGRRQPVRGLLRPGRERRRQRRRAAARARRPVLASDRGDAGFEIEARPRGSTEPSLVKARFVVDAAGLHADEVADMVDAGGFTIRARKGEEYLLDKRLQGYVKRIVFPCPTPTSKGILLIPTYDGTLMVGPTADEVDWADKDDLTTTAEGSAEVFEGARKLAPGISEADCIAEFAGLRAVSDTEEFVLGPSRVAGFVLAAGMQSPGLTAAPAVAIVVLEALRDDGLELVAKDDFVPGVPSRCASRPWRTPSSAAWPRATPPTRASCAAASWSPRARCATRSSAAPAPSTASSSAPAPAWAAARAASAPGGAWSCSQRELDIAVDRPSPSAAATRGSRASATRAEVAS